MNNTQQFDYLIIGGGLAGLQLAMAFAQDIYFEDISIAIIEPSEKINSDKNWSFWENNKTSKWSPIIQHEWKSALVKSNTKTLNLNINPYVYRTINSADFYKLAKEKIEIATNIVWVQDEIEKVENNIGYGKKANYSAELIFDSRIDPSFYKSQSSINIKQHFKGWWIESEEANFNSEQFIMMDFSVQHKDSCCFTYVLPISKTKALVEFTLFTPELIQDEEYDAFIKKYIAEVLNLKKYNVVEQEAGVIPMSTFNFESANSKNYLKIGTAGGWVKASSGYSFKSVERKTAQIIDNIKYDNKLNHNLFKKRFKFYDRILLRILQEENNLGNRIFEEMYTKNTTSQIFKFLDEETSLLEEIKIINSFKKAPFLRSLKKEIQ